MGIYTVDFLMWCTRLEIFTRPLFLGRSIARVMSSMTLWIVLIWAVCYSVIITTHSSNFLGASTFG